MTTGRERKLDGEPSVSIARYEIVGDQFRRVQPLAMTPEDFLDEWVRLGWEEAARWSSQSGEADLQMWHSNFNSLASDSTEIEFVQSCHEQRKADKVWLVSLWIDQRRNPTIKDERLYIVVSERQRAFFVDAVSTSRPAGCAGKSRPLATNWTLPEW